ncbi:hypothetical protein B0T26DRAFT_739059 [Lasiosphaeria miniovina]|uniref:Uncharacterized protein n=1 Tax=Lasiosphaeria miniovina TaxID=1954250 RepID=A0AA40B6Z8_9PEZI|nr:uncharacterized protein B0T26DRAFT_739059 [Lasiosphaeria miniovina]KAK0728847.1 hypothetical protein B0T26DRAFT_739059 [Lasiosphaeria miniovina]
MKTELSAIFWAVLVLAGLASATAISPKPPKAPGLTYLYTVNITGGDLYEVGAGPRGTRIVVPILSGSFSGPKFKGTVLPLGGDWELVDANHPGNGTVTIDVRQTFKTDDGALIQVFESGATQTDGTAHVRLTYETGSQKYYWINSIVAIGIIRPLPAGSLQIQAWQMTTPT